MPDEKIQLGEFVLDVARYELTRSGEPLRLERIPMDLLILLVRAHGRLVGREEIIDRLWGKDVFFDTDNSINTAMRKIRRALGEDPEKPRFIETVPGKGYRFKVANGGVQKAAAIAELVRPATMVAVLPFENLSGDPAHEYFADGLTEETIMRLGKMAPRELGIIARTSSMAYKHTEKSVAQIGRELGVDYIIEGSVRREPERIRVTAQIIRVSDQIHLWAENFDRPPHGILDIHSEVGAVIAAQVKLELTPQGKRQLTGGRSNDPRAYDDYLHGRYHWARVTFPEMRKASDYFRKATERDPHFALAYAGLADSLVILPINSDVPTRNVLPELQASIAKALQFGPDSAEAHTSSATMKFWCEWDFAGAERAARRAIELDGNYSLAYMYLAHVLSNIGKHEEALAVIQRAILLDPFSLITNTMYGQFLYHAGLHQESIREFHKTLEMESHFWVTHICMAKTYVRQERYAEALASCEKAWKYSGENSEALSLAGYTYAVAGETEKAEGKIQQMLQRREVGYVPPYNVALVYAGLGQLENAIAWLEKAYEERDVHMVFLRDHKWDGLRGAKEFQKLFAQAGF